VGAAERRVLLAGRGVSSSSSSSDDDEEGEERFLEDSEGVGEGSAFRNSGGGVGVLLSPREERAEETEEIVRMGAAGGGGGGGGTIVLLMAFWRPRPFGVAIFRSLAATRAGGATVVVLVALRRPRPSAADGAGRLVPSVEVCGSTRRRSSTSSAARAARRVRFAGGPASPAERFLETILGDGKSQRTVESSRVLLRRGGCCCGVFNCTILLVLKREN
jgi:hypothetical protein